MNMKTSMWIVWGLSLSGVLFSGVLSYSELFRRQCMLGGCTYLGSLPSCVYGFVVFCLLFGVASIALLKQDPSSNKKSMKKR